ncbi:MAG: glycosyltransferase family 4 protein [Lutibacter sp.]|uniref:glycosyltransferase family 4 protein n=1 Tax=Lutibacter sp. TaxID=1925666 RepID=UPI00299DDA1C|nr:glycosyltransferase family 4 protein [Lutibacter sp.]MDX1828376.1 glycosyltransferase family 4 protein [Lutibacter sp.]
MTKKIKIGYVTASNPMDKKSWSGTHYKMFESLKNEFEEVYALGPIKKPILLKATLLVYTLTHFLLFFKKFKKNHSKLLSKYYAYKINRILKNKNIDVLFAPAGSVEIAYLKNTIPICYLSDTSFGQITNYYSSFSNISRFSYKEANLIEQLAINNSFTQVYSSNWAAKYVINNYKAVKENVFTVNFGANIDFIPQNIFLEKDFRNTINLLFIGVNWKRKGGDIVLKTFDILVNKGYDLTLTICGCIPPKLMNKPNIKVIPFLDKNNKKDHGEFLNILYKTHLLFVPTRADCTPIVFCEANAFGIPVITTNTGGVNAIIKNGVNGYALPFKSTPNDYAIKIQSLLDYRLILNSIAISSRKKFEKELNWKVWGVKMREILLFTAEKNTKISKKQVSKRLWIN